MEWPFGSKLPGVLRKLREGRGNSLVVTAKNGLNKKQDNGTAILTLGKVVSEDVVVWLVREEREHCFAVACALCGSAGIGATGFLVKK